jgi:formate dehydrogenase (coenzyme F420) beta subunit
MNVNRVLEVHDGDPVDTLRGFLVAWWEQYHLEMLLAPVEQKDQRGLIAKVIEAPAELVDVNPFAPVMSENAASTANRLLQENSGKRLAVILRPCELRAFVELQKRQRPAVGQAKAVVIGVDCLGTYSKTDYERAVEESGLDEVTAEVLRNAAEGGFRPQHFRTACQICDWPAPRGADLIIGTIGIESDKHLLLVARDDKTDAALGLGDLVSELARRYQVSRREMVVGAIADMHAGLRNQMIEDMKGVYRFDDLGSILAWLASCSLCGECLKACPIYEGEFAGLLNRRRGGETSIAPLGDMVGLSRWLASCAGCGMCEEGCNMHVPLFLLISALSHRIRDKMHYHSGDPAEQLPWMSI